MDFCPTKTCSVGDCGLREKDLSSMDIPEHVRVTIYTKPDFQGESLTLKGPKWPRDTCLSQYKLAGGDSWNDVAQSVKIDVVE